MPTDLIAARWAKAEAVRLERVRRGLSQGKVGEMVGLDQSVISRAEMGAGADSTYTAVAKALGIELPEAAE